jgi:hypothetical protein
MQAQSVIFDTAGNAAREIIEALKAAMSVK